MVKSFWARTMVVTAHCMYFPARATKPNKQEPPCSFLLKGIQARPEERQSERSWVIAVLEAEDLDGHARHWNCIEVPHEVADSFQHIFTKRHPFSNRFEVWEGSSRSSSFCIFGGLPPKDRCTSCFNHGFRSFRFRGQVCGTEPGLCDELLRAKSSLVSTGRGGGIQCTNIQHLLVSSLENGFSWNPTAGKRQSLFQGCPGNGCSGVREGVDRFLKDPLLNVKVWSHRWPELGFWLVGGWVGGRGSPRNGRAQAIYLYMVPGADPKGHHWSTRLHHTHTLAFQDNLNNACPGFVVWNLYWTSQTLRFFCGIYAYIEPLKPPPCR